jgi:hypothetical protein
MHDLRKSLDEASQASCSVPGDSEVNGSKLSLASQDEVADGVKRKLLQGCPIEDDTNNSTATLQQLLQGSRQKRPAHNTTESKHASVVINEKSSLKDQELLPEQEGQQETQADGSRAKRRCLE